MSRLTEDDQARVNRYLARPENSQARSPFSPVKLLAVIFVVLAGITAISYFIAFQQGVV